MKFKVIIYTRETIVSNAKELVKLNDKRSSLITRFENYENTVSFFKISNRNILLTEMKDAFSQFKTDDESDLLLFIDDRSTTSLSSEMISRLIEEIYVALNEVKIFYLANSMDNCESISLIQKLPDDISHIRFIKAKSPNGLYGVCSTFKFWEEIFSEMDKRSEQYATAKLSALIVNGIISAGTSYPRILVPDITKFILPEDNFATYPCAYNMEYGVIQTDSENKSFFWLLLGIILTIFALWIITKITPKNRAYVIVGN